MGNASTTSRKVYLCNGIETQEVKHCLPFIGKECVKNFMLEWNINIQPFSNSSEGDSESRKIQSMNRQFRNR